ncbi:MAG: B12-binding domain-containing radical SAM protein [Chitinophagales bacterium]|nr:B12-binding domain-containing radical SAM protein [Chitinophagales bacterium]MDW8417806.1 radical SAM protein [Chitinophagales bacterium]
MNIVLIRPPKLMIRGTLTMKPVAPLGLAYIAAAAESAGHNVRVIDAIANNICEFHPTELGNDIIIQGMRPEVVAELVPCGSKVIGLSCMFSNNWLLDRRLIKVLRSRFPEAVLIAGGESISGMPEYALKDSELDICVVGEGEETFKEVLSAIENQIPLVTVKGIVFKKDGKIVLNPRRERIRQLNDIPYPAWHFFPVNAYFDNQITLTPTERKSLPTLATRGCPYTCTFCSSPNMWTTKYSLRSPDNILQEMIYMYEKYGVTNFELFDLTAIINRQWILEFCRLLQNYPVHFTWQMPAGTRSEALSEEVIREMAKAGCTNITFAPESGSKKVLQLIQKKADPDKMLPAMKLASQLGMYVYVNSIIGLPGETHRDIWKSMLYLAKTAFAGAQDTGMAVFMPYPGSELFKQFEQYGQLSLSDSFFYDILYTDSITKSQFYNNNIPSFIYRIYNILLLTVFYIVSYSSHPSRIYKSLRNVIKRRYVTRGERAIGYLMEQYFSLKKSPVHSLHQPVSHV